MNRGEEKNRRNICRALKGEERDEKMTDGQALSLKLLEWATAMQWVNVREEFDEDKLREDLHSQLNREGTNVHFSSLNPLAIYLGFLYLYRNQITYLTI